MTGTLIQLIQSEDVLGLMYHVSLHIMVKSSMSTAGCVEGNWPRGAGIPQLDSYTMKTCVLTASYAATLEYLYTLI